MPCTAPSIPVLEPFRPAPYLEEYADPLAHEMRNEVALSSREVESVGDDYHLSPSAVVSTRLVLLLVLGTTASLEEARIR